MRTIVGVSFDGVKQIYYFDPKDLILKSKGLLKWL